MKSLIILCSLIIFTFAYDSNSTCNIEDKYIQESESLNFKLPSWKATFEFKHLEPTHDLDLSFEYAIEYSRSKEREIKEVNEMIYKDYYSNLLRIHYKNNYLKLLYLMDGWIIIEDHINIQDELDDDDDYLYSSSI